MYSLICLKCKKNFLTEDEAAADGEEFCEFCKVKNKEIAEKIDAQIATKRVLREKKEMVNPYLEIRTNPKLRNKRTIQYMNLPR